MPKAKLYCILSIKQILRHDILFKHKCSRIYGMLREGFPLNVYSFPVSCCCAIERAEEFVLKA